MFNPRKDKPSDFIPRRRSRRPSPSDTGTGAGPQPRFTSKHVHNPPIVTIFGAGIAGLTAAHELIDRGFLVQVVEKQRDVYRRGRPQVGGMAATQYARVRANIEDLHQSLLDKPKVTESDNSEAKVRSWLLRLFAFNRSFWLQTETPIEMNSCLYSLPDSYNGVKDGQTFGQRVADTLLAQRTTYRDNWLWDLVVRSALLTTVVHDRDDDDDDSPSSKDRRHKREQDIDKARYCYEKLVKADTTLEIAKEILKIEELVVRSIPTSSAKAETSANPYLPALPNEEALEKFAATIEDSLQREFLCFRLIPYARANDPELIEKARDKLAKWEAHFRGAGLGPNLIGHGELCGKAIVHKMSAPDALPDEQGTWLELEIIEQRLPGEHGFRFFPSYYRHIDDTMKRIPLIDCCGEQRGTAYDNFRSTTVEAIGLSREDRDLHKLKYLDRVEPVEIDRTRAPSLEVMRKRSTRFLDLLGCTRKDAALFAARLLRFMTSSSKRRHEQYQDMSWAEFVGTKPHGDKKCLSYSPAMVAQIEASAQCILALSAGEADARTYGDATVQLLMDMMSGDGSKTDRTLNGPTSDAWLEPWREYLEQRGARFFSGQLSALQWFGDELVPKVDLFRELSENGYPLLEHPKVQLDETKRPKERHLGSSPDFYVLALDIHQTNELLKGVQSCGDKAQDFDAFKEFFKKATTNDPAKSRARGGEGNALKNMTGVQFFFEAKTSIGKGHICFPYSKWGLSCISQSEFWSERGGFSDGYLAVLSVDVSDLRDKPKRGRAFEAALKLGSREWKKGLKLWSANGRPASGGRAEKILEDQAKRRLIDDRLGRWLVARDVWGQLKDRIGTRDQLSQPRVFHVDRNIKLADCGLQNSSPYLATLPGTWNARPGVKPNGKIEYAINYDRWVMCGTYMATHTRMTTMEAANESARHAVQAILRRLGEAAPALDARSMMVDPTLWSYVDPVTETKYNGASQARRYDPPDVWDPEAKEPEDFEDLRRLDEKLAQMGLPHWMDICEFDRRLELSLEMAELAEQDVRSLAGMDKHGEEMFRSAMAGLEVALKQSLGDEYKLGPTMQSIVDLTRGFVWGP